MTTVATIGATWIDDVCRRASEALGWELEFQPAADDSPWRGADEPLWQADIHDGAELTGRLRLAPAQTDADEADLRTAVATASLVAELVGRLATANRKLESRSRDVNTLMELGRALPQGSTLPEALDRLLRAASQLTGYWGSAFFLVDSRRAQLRLRLCHGIERNGVPIPDRPLGQPSPDSAALLHSVAILDREDPRSTQWLPAGCPVGFSVPVHAPEGPLGTLWCYDRRHRTVTDRDVHVLQSVAAQIAAVLERTVLLKDSAARKRLRDEIHVASQHHTSGAVCPLPLDSGLDVAFRSANAAELGGDLCEVWPAGPRRTLIAVGDAVGHSIPAALVMAIARGSLRTLLQGETEQLARTDLLMRRINQTLCTVTRAEQFMTLVCGVIDLQAMTLTYTNAGHPLPWLSRDGQRTELTSHGLLLGVMPEAGYRHSVLPLRAGDLLLFFTDGVSEAMSRDRSFFRTEGVLNALGDDAWSSAAAAADAIWTRLNGHTGRSGPADDQTLLVVKVEP
jgi:sigma-B regulation protein RsbU (phosphoserine phosphatase)